jgi:hypothetical protein
MSNYVYYKVAGVPLVPSIVFISPIKNGTYCRAIRLHIEPAPRATVALDSRVLVNVVIGYVDDSGVPSTYSTGAMMPNTRACDIDLTAPLNGPCDHGAPIAPSATYTVAITTPATFIATLTVQTIH